MPKGSRMIKGGFFPSLDDVAMVNMKLGVLGSKGLVQQHLGKL